MAPDASRFTRIPRAGNSECTWTVSSKRLVPTLMSERPTIERATPEIRSQRVRGLIPAVWRALVQVHASTDYGIARSSTLALSRTTAMGPPVGEIFIGSR